MNKQKILSMANLAGDPYASLYFEPDLEGKGGGLILLNDEQLIMKLRWYAKKSNENLTEHGFSFYYTRQVFSDYFSYFIADKNDPNLKGDHYRVVGKPFADEDALLIVTHYVYIDGIFQITKAYPANEDEYRLDYENFASHKRILMEN